MTNFEFAAGLRRVADIYDDNPNIEQIFGLTGSGGSIYCHSKEAFAAAVRAFGPGRKSDDEDGLVFIPDIVAPLNIRIYGFKNACCERVQVGEKVVEAHGEIVIPASPATVVPIYEYRCAPFLESDSLLAEAKEHTGVEA